MIYDHVLMILTRNKSQGMDGGAFDWLSVVHNCFEYKNLMLMVLLG